MALGPVLLAVVVGLGATLAAETAHAQAAAKIARIGYLAVAPRPADDIFRQELFELGYIEGRNLAILSRWGGSGEYAPLAQDLVRAKVT